MVKKKSSFKAYGIAFFVCSVLQFLFVYAWQVLELSIFEKRDYSLFVTVALIAFVSVIVFQAIRIHDTASALAEDMAESMFYYTRELSSQLFRESPVPYIVVNQTLTVDAANLAARRLYGVDESWFRNRNIFETFSGDTDQRIGLITGYFRERLSVHDEEIMVTRPDSTTRWVRLSLFSFTDIRHAQKGLLTLVDVTKQKEVDKAKTEFVSLASHQLRTPISAMKWNIELLENETKGYLSNAGREYLDKVERGLFRMDSLVDDFLSVSKLELGTFVPERMRVDFSPFIEPILESHESRARARLITIEKKWDESFTLVTDPHLLEMVMSNLISNAVKYAKEGGVVRVTGVTEEGKHRFSVSDTGIGIPLEEQDKIFSKIFRASNARQEVSEGTGLGLYIVHEVVRVLGGEVSFTSTPEEGTTFTVVLPE